MFKSLIEKLAIMKPQTIYIAADTWMSSTPNYLKYLRLRHKPVVYNLFEPFIQFISICQKSNGMHCMYMYIGNTICRHFVYLTEDWEKNSWTFVHHLEYYAVEMTAWMNWIDHHFSELQGLQSLLPFSNTIVGQMDRFFFIQNC